MEPFCVILKRTLASEHPLHQILKYHCRDVTIPNSVGTPALVNEGNFMDQLFAFGNKGTVRLLKDGYHITTWEVTDFRGEIKVLKYSRLMVVARNEPVLNHPTYLRFLLDCMLSPQLIFRPALDPPLITIDGGHKNLAIAFRTTF